MANLDTVPGDVPAEPKTGGTAFPSGVGTAFPSRGMSLRDYFAAAVIDGACRRAGKPGVNTEYMEAERAYRIADAMLKARDAGALQPFPWALAGEPAFAAATEEVLRALDLQSDVFMANNPRRGPEDRAAWQMGWCLQTLTLLIRSGLMKDGARSALAIETIGKIHDASKEIAKAFVANARKV